MAKPVKAVPEGRPTVLPALVCKGAAKAIDYYKKVFGAKELHRTEGPGGTIAHAELGIGNSIIMLSDEFSSMAQAPSACTGHALYVYLEDCDAAFQRAVAAGGKSVMPVMNQFWGDRHGVFEDPFGHRWNVATHVEDVGPEELGRRAKEWMAKAAKAGAQGH